MTVDPVGDRTADLDLALAAVRSAGEAAMRSFRSVGPVRHKAPDQPVTEADLEADRLLADHLRGARPDYGWLSEESTDDRSRLERPRVWIVDPIDGTRSFIAGYREFAVSVALVEDGEAVLGVISNPSRDDVTWAVRGSGAYRARHWTGGTAGGEQVRVVGPGTGEPAALLVSRAERARGEFHAFGDGWTLRPFGSTACKLAGVAHGFGHGYLSRGDKSEWDVAAGVVIVEEAGGEVTDLAGRRLRFNRADTRVSGIVAGAPGVHARLLAAAAASTTAPAAGGLAARTSEQEAREGQ
jgi:myo-inositol-1(or 4)-monophosphatase